MIEYFFGSPSRVVPILLDLVKGIVLLIQGFMSVAHIIFFLILLTFAQISEDECFGIFFYAEKF